MGTTASQPAPREDETIDATLVSSVRMLSSLCRWSIQYDYYSLPISSPPRSPPRFPTENLNLNDEKSWPTWPGSCDSEPFTGKLSDNLESNDFSNLSLDGLPIAVDLMARATRGSPKELLKEARGFSIMSRNVNLVIDLLEEIGENVDITGLYPLHLAVRYLDGSKTCCNVLEALDPPRALRKIYVNDLGHSVLDQLMITILKAHTSCLPSVVDVIFKKDKRFEGEEVDICGRWNADSDCVRTLLVNGPSGVPFQWKHMFCHTSVQTSCHCLGTVFGHGPQWRPDINVQSVLLLRRCSHCGLKLQLLPLHTLILVGLHLSRSACKNETPFGILACLLCLLSYGANPLLRANVSVQALLGDEDVDECSHEEIDPVELAMKVPASLSSMWSRELSTGWQVITNVLGHSRAEWKARPSRRRSNSNEREDEHEFSTFIEYGED